MTAFSKKRAGFVFLVTMSILLTTMCFVFIIIKSSFADKAWTMFESIWIWWTGVSVGLMRNMQSIEIRKRDEESSIE
jgi:hypothetical protein